jgi:excinuclease ABC subunit C
LPKKKELVGNPRLATLRRRVAKAPTVPGVYRWLDKEGTVLYVGKAKNLRNRLRSYVTKDTAAGPWKQSFLEQITDFDLTVTNTEVEALIFETNLIKELRPKYNILMKDDKNYIYARVTVQDPYPRVEAARKIEEDGSKYFGPMATGGELWAMLTMLRSIFPFRTCTMEILPLPPAPSPEGGGGNKQEQIHLDVICHHKDRPTPCLDFHIEKCSAPCIGRRTPEEYQKESIEGVMKFLKGDYESVRPVIRERMEKAATDRRFELAAQFRDYLEALDRLEGKQLITDTSGEDSDIIAVALLSGRADVVVMQRRNGRLIGDRTFSLAGHAEHPSEVLEQFLPQFYEEGSEVPEEILINAPLPGREVFEAWLSAKKGRRVKVILPARGRKSQLLQLAEKNVLEKARQREAKWEAEKRNTEAALAQLQETLALPAPPLRIEGYDISHLGGTETVGSMVVIKGGKAANDQYRSFTIRSLRAGEVDDYQALKEVLLRRLRHLPEIRESEAKKWESRGVTFGKARKADQMRLDAVACDPFSTLRDRPLRYKECFVAREGEGVAAVGRIFKHPNGLLELEHVWVAESHEQTTVGSALLRMMLKTLKKGKAYVCVDAGKENAYASFGFRYVIKSPPLFQERLAKLPPDFPPQLVMVYEAKAGKADPSLSSRPDLIVIDGGKGQLNAALEVLTALKVPIPVLGLAKREEEVFIAGQSDPVTFPQDSSAKFLLMRLRDEAHRSANRHREARGKKSSKASVLDAVPGLGEEGKKALLRKFGSISAIREASDEELRELVSELQLKELRRHLR